MSLSLYKFVKKKLMNQLQSPLRLLDPWSVNQCRVFRGDFQAVLVRRDRLAAIASSVPSSARS